MNCTNEEPCGNCDICDNETNDGNCVHGEYFMNCRACNPKPLCAHGVETYYDECETCEHEAQLRDDAEMDSDEEHHCKHDIPESECLDCGAEMDAKAERFNARQDWDHFHND